MTSVTTLEPFRPYDRVDELRHRLSRGGTLTNQESWELLHVIADQRATLASLHDEQWQEAYREYLRGPAWQSLREAALRNAKYKCELCNHTRRLHVHHRDYAHVFHERPEDLIVLCRKCHAVHHRRAS